MSKTAEERIAELESRIQDMGQENNKLQSYYNQAYQAMEEARKNESYLKGKLESTQSAPQGAYQEPDSNSYADSLDSNSIERALDRIVSEKLEPRDAASKKWMDMLGKPKDEKRRDAERQDGMSVAPTGKAPRKLKDMRGTK